MKPLGGSGDSWFGVLVVTSRFQNWVHRIYIVTAYLFSYTYIILTVQYVFRFRPQGRLGQCTTPGAVLNYRLHWLWRGDRGAGGVACHLWNGRLSGMRLATHFQASGGLTLSNRLPGNM